jgi:hypothetical protein
VDRVSQSVVMILSANYKTLRSKHASYTYILLVYNVLASWTGKLYGGRETTRLVSSFWSYLTGKKNASSKHGKL